MSSQNWDERVRQRNIGATNRAPVKTTGGTAETDMPKPDGVDVGLAGMGTIVEELRLRAECFTALHCLHIAVDQLEERLKEENTLNVC